MSKRWFSAMLVFAVIVEGIGLERYARTIIVFKAFNFDSAKSEALKLGRAKETKYKNGEDKEVIWKLDSIETLDLLGEEIVNGREVYSEFQQASDKKVTAESEFHPELSEPTQTGV